MRKLLGAMNNRPRTDLVYGASPAVTVMVFLLRQQLSQLERLLDGQ